MHILEHAIEVERLALLALQLIEGPQRSEPALEKSFREALPRALRLVELTEEFLKQKEAERNAYWETPEGKAEREARLARFRARYNK
ncbi:MAG: hypothetical protein WCC08_21420 [Terrimicrobiaceae bacterium]|jgi:hypothetical protein